MVASDREFRDELAKRIERGVDSGEFARSIDSAGFATVLVGRLRGIALQSMLDEGIDLAACRLEVEALLTGRVLP